MGLGTYRDWRDVENTRFLENIREMTSAAIMSQYSASKHILALAAQYQENLNPMPDIDLLFEKMFDITTAEGVGLDNWGANVNQPRTILDDGVAITLDDDYYRALLFYKLLANITDSTAYSQNTLLQALISTGIGNFPQGFVVKSGTMAIRWVFMDSLNAQQLAVFKAAGTLPRGTGVMWELSAYSSEDTFGFDGSEMQPFNQAPFAPDNAIITG